jgi:hypothetical protein
VHGPESRCGNQTLTRPQLRAASAVEKSVACPEDAPPLTDEMYGRTVVATRARDAASARPKGRRSLYASAEVNHV